MENEEIFEFTFIPGFRSSSSLLYIEKEQQIFKFRYKSKDLQYFYCYEKKCKFSVAIEFNNPMYCRKTGKQTIHNHGSQYELFKKLELINSIKNNVKTAPIKRSNVRDIFDDQCKKFKDASQAIEYGKMRRNLFRINQKNYPPSPNTFAGIIDLFKNEDARKQFGMSKIEIEKQFYVGTIITDDFAYTVFASPTIVSAILSLSTSEPRNFIFDGTFYAVPTSKEFKQLLIIHIVHAEHAFPFLYILMSSKTEKAYIHMLQYLKSNVLDLHPMTIITDYEKSLRNAIKKVYPTAKMVGCWFHYTNALRRNAIKIAGFQRFLNTNDQAKQIFNKFLYLPLMKPQDITAAFEILKADAMNANYLKENANYFESFINYFESYWIKKEKVQNFSVHKEPIRTSNSAEGFHSQLNLKLPKHGNILKLMDVLTDLDISKSSDFSKSIAGHTSIFSKKNYFTKRNEFVQKRYQLYENNIITLNTFLAQLSKMKNCKIEKNFVNIIDSNDEESDECQEESTAKENSEYNQCGQIFF